MATVLITGGTGLIGRQLTHELLAKNYKVIILSRGKKSSETTGVSFAQWDVAAQTFDEEAIKKADFIIHLAGANVADGRWTEKRKREIVRSRTNSAALLVKALKEVPNKVKAVISSSAIGWYGADAQAPNLKPFIETDPADQSFLGTTCKAWEESIKPAASAGRRLVIVRIGIVLSREGGAYAEFKKPLKFATAAILGNGKQVVSFIHIADIARLFIHAIENEKMDGIYNGVAPQPVSNQRLMQTIAREHGGLAVPVHVPEFALKLALGEMSIEVLKSTTVSSAKTLATGFQFLFPSVEAAVHNLETAPL